MTPMAFLSVVPARSEASPFRVTDTHLYLPGFGLSSCVRAYVSRNTVGLDLAASDLLNHYAASPLCTIMWTLEGRGELIWKGGEAVNEEISEPILLSGPHTAPSITRNIGGIHGFMAFFLADALQLMTGMDISALVNQTLPVAKVLDASWQQMANDVLRADSDVARIQCLEQFLLPRWQARHANRHEGVARYREWMTGLATRAALSGAGRSTRQLERRVKRWSGLPLQRLKSLARAETSFFEVRAAIDAAMLDWAEVAFNTGFSDQAHMCREVKRMTGFTPEAFRQAMKTEESFWLYRLWM
jgi:AraC-like DNA-binding protein